MIQTELLKDGKLIRHYSDEGKMIRQVETGTEYSEAIDVVPCNYTYKESEESYDISGEELIGLIEEVL